MGGLSKLAHNIGHSISHAAKSIVSGVTKAFKSVVNEAKRFLQSDLGKIVIIGATIWLGGAALGYWSSGFSTIDGALVATQAGTAAAAAPVAEAGVGAAATDAAASAATGGLAGGSGLGAVPEAAGTTGMATGAGTAGVGAGVAAAPVDYAAANAALTAPAQGGFMSTAGGAISGAAKWMAANPIPTLIGGQMLSSALSPNQLDVNDQQNQFRIDEENRRQAQIDQANARIAGVGAIPAMQYSGATLPVPQQPVPGQAAGIMGRRLTI